MSRRLNTPFPHAAVLTDLLKGIGYRATAERHGYFEENRKDRTKNFRNHLKLAREKGFLYNGVREKYPRFDRTGRFIVDGQTLTPWVNSLVAPVLKASKQKTKPKSSQAKPGTARVRTYSKEPKGRPPENTILVIESGNGIITLKTPTTSTQVLAARLAEAIISLSAILEKNKKADSVQVRTTSSPKKPESEVLSLYRVDPYYDKEKGWTVTFTCSDGKEYPLEGFTRQVEKTY